MPTGITAPVAEGKITDLRGFALRAARSMGAFVRFRDEPDSFELPRTQEPDPYYAEELAKARAERARILALTPEEVEAENAAANEARVRYATERIAERQQTRALYEAMLAKVRAWENPPQGIREFMIEQLEQSIKWDCETAYYERETVAMTAEAWLASELEQLDSSIKHHAEREAKERENISKSNAWTMQLFDSLEPKEDAHGHQ